jgi:hypothetical protein
MKTIPFQVFEVDYTDSTTNDRQLNVAFAEFPGYFHNSFTMSADSLGGKLLIYIFNSNYSDTNSFYQNPANDLFSMQGQYDIMYTWSPKLIAPGAWFNNGDVMYVYPYTITRPYVQGNLPLYYEFHTVAPLIGDINSAKETGALSKIKVVPNPYYGFSTLDRSTSDRFVRFTNLPLNCKIKIYTLNGDLIKVIDKPNDGSLYSSTAEWNLQNQDRVPVSSGIYIALIDAPNIGQKVIKIAIFTSQERLNF